MNNFRNNKSSYKEYAPGCYNITCTEEEFVNELDHTQLNKGHYFIEVMRPVNPLTLMLAPREITVQLTWANDVIEPTKTIPIRKIDFENNTIYVNKEFKEEIKAFKKARFWQIEVLRLNIFVITAPKKPKIIFL